MVRCLRPLCAISLGCGSALGLAPVSPIASRHSAPWSIVRNRYNSNLPLSSSLHETSAAGSLQSDEGATSTNANDEPSQRKGVWMPPSQTTQQQQRKKIFSIQQPEDLLDFVVEDERLSVVKVYASWCKTCKVFDLRYRKVASQFGDKYDDKTGAVTDMGRARFAEMQYDNPNNEEMSKLLNATKLPYIIMYKGSRGKVNEFQCGPAKVQMLIDAVNELADPVVELGAPLDTGLDKPVVLDGRNLAASPQVESVTLQSKGEDTAESLQQQLIDLESEKVEMFSIMKAQIESDKVYINKLEAGVETQRLMIEEKDDGISKLKTALEERVSTLKSKDDEIQTLTDNLNNEEQKGTQQSKEELSAYKSKVSQLTEKISQTEESITSLGLESAYNEKAAKESKKLLMEKTEKWEEQKELYEQERHSFRKLFMLGVKRVVSIVRRKR